MQVSARCGLVVALVAVGCHKSAPPPAPPPADQAAACLRSIANAQQRAMEAGFAAQHVTPTDKELKMQHIIIDHQTHILAPVCASDVWAPEVLKCLDDATTDNDDKKCLGMLSDEQTRHWHEASEAATTVVGRGSGFHTPP